MAKYDAMFDPRKHNRPGTYAKSVVVFRRGKDLIVRKYVKPKNPRTPGQVASREKLGTRSKKVALAWAKLTLEERDRCRRLAQKRGLATGFMAYTQIWWSQGSKPGKLTWRAPREGRQMALKMKSKKPLKP